MRGVVGMIRGVAGMIRGVVYAMGVGCDGGHGLR